MRTTSDIIASLGGLSKVAGMVKCPITTVQSWRDSGRFPAERVPEIEAATGIPRHELRPDLWDKPFIFQDGNRIERNEVAR